MGEVALEIDSADSGGELQWPPEKIFVSTSEIAEKLRRPRARIATIQGKAGIDRQA